MLARIAYGASAVGVAYLMSGAALVWWAYALLWRDPELLTRVNVYHELAALAPASTWGVACLTLGALQILAYRVALPRIMAPVGFLAACWWSAISAGFFAVPQPTTAEGIYAIFAFASFWGAAVLWKAR